MFWDTFIDLCAKNGKKPNPVAKELGFGSSAVTHWKRGTVPSDISLKKIADYFGVSVDYLLGKEEQPTAPSRTAHSITLRGRDGSIVESDLTDEQIEIFKNMLKQFKGNK